MNRRTSKTKLNPPRAMTAVIKGLFRGPKINLLLTLGIIISAFMLIIVSHDQRQLYAKLEKFQQHRDQLDIEWRQLRLEQRVVAEHSRLEQLARDKLGLQNLDIKSERIVRQVKDDQ